MPGTLIVKDGLLVTSDAAGTRWDRADVVIEGTDIAAIGPDAGQGVAGPGVDCTVIDASDAIVLPGLINAHLHSNEGFQQGGYDNLPLEMWLGESYPPFGFPILSARDYYLRTMLAAIESIRAGVTTVQDDYVHPPATAEAMHAALEAYDDAGIRAWVSVDMWDQPLVECLPWAKEIIPPGIQDELAAMGGADAGDQLALFETQFARWHGHDGGRIRIILAPCGPQRCTPALLEAIRGLSAAHDIPIHCHTLETRLQAVHAEAAWGMTAVAFMDGLGLLTPRTTLVHGIWLTANDITRIAERGCAVVHNPLSNMKLGSGTCPVRALLDAGITVALGTDGLATSDTADLIEAIRAAAMIHKTGTGDHTRWISAEEAFAMATTGGAHRADGRPAGQPGARQARRPDRARPRSLGLHPARRSDPPTRLLRDLGGRADGDRGRQGGDGRPQDPDPGRGCAEGRDPRGGRALPARLRPGDGGRRQTARALFRGNPPPCPGHPARPISVTESHFVGPPRGVTLRCSIRGRGRIRPWQIPERWRRARPAYTT